MVRVLTSVTAFLAVIVILAGAVAPFVLTVVAFAALQSPLLPRSDAAFVNTDLVL